MIMNYNPISIWVTKPPRHAAHATSRRTCNITPHMQRPLPFGRRDRGWSQRRHLRAQKNTSMHNVIIFTIPSNYLISNQRGRDRQGEGAGREMREGGCGIGIACCRRIRSTWGDERGREGQRRDRAIIGAPSCS